MRPYSTYSGATKITERRNISLGTPYNILEIGDWIVPFIWAASKPTANGLECQDGCLKARIFFSSLPAFAFWRKEQLHENYGPGCEDHRSNVNQYTPTKRASFIFAFRYLHSSMNNSLLFISSHLDIMNYVPIIGVFIIFEKWII